MNFLKKKEEKKSQNQFTNVVEKLYSQILTVLVQRISPIAI